MAVSAYPLNIVSPAEMSAPCFVTLYEGCLTSTALYNLIEMHKTLKMTPTVAAGLVDRFWSVGISWT